jgi:hypothetical protein
MMLTVVLSESQTGIDYLKYPSMSEEINTLW